MPNPPKPLLGHIQPVQSIASPKVSDIIFYELHNDNLVKDREPEFGDPHPDFYKYPDHKLVFIAPNDPNEPHIRKWFYAAGRCDQDDYNFERDESKLQRTYVIPRSEYLDSWVTPTDGDLDDEFPAYGFTGEEVKRVGDQTLDSYFVVIQHTYANLGKVVSGTNKGTQQGDECSAVTLGATSAALACDGSITLSRTSRLEKGDVWNNTTSSLTPRIGVHTTSVSEKPGMDETITTALSTTEPVPAAGEFKFNKRLVTRDADGVDALWAVTRGTRTNDASTDSMITPFLGGGIMAVNHSLVSEGTLATGGFLKVKDDVKALGDGNAIRSIQTIDAFPTLVDYKYDTQLDGMVKVTKTVVDASTNPVGTFAAGDVTEIKAYDKWRSFHIRSEGVGVEKTETLPGAFQFRFPPVLNSISWIGGYSYAGSGTKFDYDFDVALIFDVTEAFTAAVDGKIIRVVTKTPASVVGTYAPTVFKPQSHTIGMVNLSYYTSTSMVWAKASARTWQTPLALSGALSTALPASAPGGASVTVNASVSPNIPATSPTTIPTGWITIGVTTNRLKLGYYEVIVRQINSPGP